MSHNKTYRLALMGVLTALLFMGQVIMAVLPNIGRLPVRLRHVVFQLSLCLDSSCICLPAIKK